MLNSEITINSIVKITDKFAADWGGIYGAFADVTDVYSCGCKLEIKLNNQLIDDVRPSQVNLVTQAPKR